MVAEQEGTRSIFWFGEEWSVDDVHALITVMDSAGGQVLNKMLTVMQDGALGVLTQSGSSADDLRVAQGEWNMLDQVRRLRTSAKEALIQWQEEHGHSISA